MAGLIINNPNNLDVNGKPRGYRCVIPFSVEVYNKIKKLYNVYKIDSIGRVDINDVYTPYSYPLIESARTIDPSIEGVAEHKTLKISYHNPKDKYYQNGSFHMGKVCHSIICPIGLQMAIKLHEGDLIAWKYRGKTVLGLWTTRVGRVKIPTGYYGISVAANYRVDGTVTSKDDIWYLDEIVTDQGEIPISSPSSPTNGCPFIRLAYFHEICWFRRNILQNLIKPWEEVWDGNKILLDPEEDRWNSHLMEADSRLSEIEANYCAYTKVNRNPKTFSKILITEE